MKHETRKDHLHGKAHGSIDRHRPDQAIVVPSSQIVVPGLPMLSAWDVRERGLITFKELAERLGWSQPKTRNWVREGRFEIVGYHRRKGRDLNMFDWEKAEVAVAKGRPEPTIRMRHGKVYK